MGSCMVPCSYCSHRVIPTNNCNARNHLIDSPLQCGLPLPIPHIFSVIYVYGRVPALLQSGAKNSCLFEFPAFLPPINLGLPMHSPSAMTEHVTLNLARFFCSTLYVYCSSEGEIVMHWAQPDAGKMLKT